VGDIRRKLFAPTVTEKFAFLVEECGCVGPTVTDNWPANRPGVLDAVYHCRDFNVEITLSVGYGGDSEVEVFLIRPPSNTGHERRVDLLAYELGLAKSQSVPLGARTGYQLRHSLTVQATLTRRLIPTAA